MGFDYSTRIGDHRWYVADADAGRSVVDEDGLLSHLDPRHLRKRRTRPTATATRTAVGTWPGDSSIKTTRLSPSSEWRTAGERDPSGVAISCKFQCCMPPRYPQREGVTHGRRYTRPRERRRRPYGLGPLQTNCYVVRATAARPRRSCRSGGDAAELRLELAGSARPAPRSSITHGHFDHLGGVADLAEGTGAPVYMPEGERDRLERYSEFAPAGMPGRATRPTTCSRAARRSRSAGITFDCVADPGPLAGARRLLRRRPPVQRRPALRRLGRPRRPAGRRLGHAARLRPHARRPLSAGDDRLSRATGRRRRSAPSSSAIPFLAELRA